MALIPNPQVVTVRLFGFVADSAGAYSTVPPSSEALASVTVTLGTDGVYLTFTAIVKTDFALALSATV